MAAGGHSHGHCLPLFPAVPSPSRGFSNLKIPQENKTAQSNKKVRFSPFLLMWLWATQWGMAENGLNCEITPAGESTPAGELGWTQAAGSHARVSGCSPPTLPSLVSQHNQHVPSTALPSPRGPAHTKRPTPDTGPAPHMHSLDQDLLPQERWNRQSLGHGRWKREGDLRRSEEPQEPGLNKWQHSSPQLLSTQFKCSAKQWQLQLPAGVRYRIHIHFLHLLLKSRTRFKSNLRNYLNEANDQEILSHQEQN